VTRGAAFALRAELIRGLLGDGEALHLTASGGSMRPLLRSGDRLRVEPLLRRGLQRGDVALVRREGAFYAHRVARLDGARVVTRGDGCTFEDPPVPVHTVLGRVTGYQRGGASVALDRPVGRLLSAVSRRLGPALAHVRACLNR
jgi:signal peptidase I